MESAQRKDDSVPLLFRLLCVVGVCCILLFVVSAALVGWMHVNGDDEALEVLVDDKGERSPVHFTLYKQ